MTIKYNNKIIVGAGALLALAITATAPAQAEVCGAEGHMGACWGYHTYPSNNSVSPSVPSAQGHVEVRNTKDQPKSFHHSSTSDIHSHCPREGTVVCPSPQSPHQLGNGRMETSLRMT